MKLPGCATALLVACLYWVAPPSALGAEGKSPSKSATPVDDGSAVALPRRGSGGSTLFQKAIDQAEHDANDPQARERADRAKQDQAIAESEGIARKREAQKRAEQERLDELARKRTGIAKGPATSGAATHQPATGQSCGPEYRAMLQTFRAMHPNPQGGALEVYQRIESPSAAENYSIKWIDSGMHRELRPLPQLKPGEKHSEHPGSLRIFADYAVRYNDGYRSTLAKIPSQHTQQRLGYQFSIESADFYRCFALARAAQFESGRSGATQLGGLTPPSSTSTTQRPSSGAQPSADNASRKPAYKALVDNNKEAQGSNKCIRVTPKESRLVNGNQVVTDLVMTNTCSRLQWVANELTTKNGGVFPVWTDHYFAPHDFGYEPRKIGSVVRQGHPSREELGFDAQVGSMSSTGQRHAIVLINANSTRTAQVFWNPDDNPLTIESRNASCDAYGPNNEPNEMFRNSGTTLYRIACRRMYLPAKK